MKLDQHEFKDGIHYRFFCPGCGYDHVFDTRWKFDGNLVSPTFTPSLLGRSNRGEDYRESVCHLFVTAGKIIYLGDCTHSLAGQTVDMEEIEE